MRPAIVAVGGSLGGAEALRALLAGLPPGFAAPVAAALHRSRESGEGLVERVARDSPLLVEEAEDGARLRPGRVHLAPADYHLLVERGRLRLSIDEPVRYARPSIEILLETTAEAYGPAAVGVLLSGANDDGVRGLAAIRAAGGLAVVQEPATAERAEMPRAAIEAGAADHVLPVGEIGPFLASLVAPPATAGRGT